MIAIFKKSKLPNPKCSWKLNALSGRKYFTYSISLFLLKENISVRSETKSITCEILSVRVARSFIPFTTGFGEDVGGESGGETEGFEEESGVGGETDDWFLLSVV